MPKPLPIPATINPQEIIDATDQCVMCGLCIPHCPTYTLAQSEPESPRGRIALVRALYEGKLETNDVINSHLDSCLTCMNCERVCPANVEYEKIIDAGRAITHESNHWLKNLQPSFLLFTLSRSFARKVINACLPIPSALQLHKIFTGARLLHLLPDTNATSVKFNAALPSKYSGQSSNAPTVAILNSCAGDLVNDTAENAAGLILSKLGCKIIQQKQTLCCGALHQHTGDLKTAKELRQKFIRHYEKQNPDFLISLATGCGAQIKRYPELEANPAKKLSKKLFDINDFVLQKIENSKLEFKPLNGKVYLHKPCSQAQVSTQDSAVEQLLDYIPGTELVYFEDKLSCCGAGGINTISQNKMAEQLIEHKVLELKNSSVDYLVSSNIGCALHFQAKLRQQGIPTQVSHPITLLAQQLL